MKKVLVVDDNDDVRLILQSTFKAENYQVVAAENGAVALKIAKEFLPDLIISDILMPEMDGFQLCKNIRKDPQFIETIFVFYTATYTDEKDEKFALSLGADSFLVKPMEGSELLQRVRLIQRTGPSFGERDSAEAQDDESDFLKTYNQRLINKLEKKISDLESETKAREEADSFLKATLEAVPDMIFRLDAHGTFLDYKPANSFEPLIPADKFLNRNVMEVLPADLAKETMQNIEKAVTSGEVVEFIYQLPLGERICDYEARYSCTDKNEIIVFIRDITREYSARRNLAKRETQYRKLFENSPDAISITTVDGEILDVNPAFLKIYGYSREEALELNANALYADVNERANFLATIRKNGFVKDNQAKRRCKDGTEIICDTSAVAQTDADGNIIDLQCTTRDVTEMHNLQKQLLQANKMESIGHLAGGVAHDFNNMLSIIFGYAELVQAKLSSVDPIYKDLNEIIGAAKRSKQLVHQLLAFAKQQPIAQEVLDLDSLVESNLSMLERLIGEDVEIQYTKNKKLWNISADPTHVNQLLTNLAVNARDAIGGVGMISIVIENITLDEEYCYLHHKLQPGEYVCLHFSDTGSGMSKEVQERIFEPFYSTKPLGAGTGLGLSTVHGIVEQNGGAIFVYSEPGHGTTFRIYLPRDAAGDVSGELASKEPDYNRGNGETILVVEDEVVILKLSKRILQKQGYNVLGATTPGEALLLVEKYEGDIDLLITDVVMPNMNGKELAERITLAWPDVKVVYMSGYTAQIISKRGVVADGSLFIEKPFSSKSLTQIVLRALTE